MTTAPAPFATVHRRTFDALSAPPGTPERARLNRDALSSEYLTGSPYLVRWPGLMSDGTPNPAQVFHSREFKTKTAAQDFANALNDRHATNAAAAKQSPAALKAADDIAYALSVPAFRDRIAVQIQRAIDADRAALFASMPQPPDDMGDREGLEAYAEAIALWRAGAGYPLQHDGPSSDPAVMAAAKLSPKQAKEAARNAHELGHVCDEDA